MSKLSRIILILCIFTILFIPFAFATNTNDNALEENDTSINDSSDESNIDEENTTSTPQTTSYLGNSGVTNVSQISDYSEANLGLNNILNIILIAIGVLIILFAIAILIRLKQ